MGASCENPYASPQTKAENAEPLWKRRGKISLLLEWGVAVGGASTAHALLGAARALPIEMHAPLPADAEDGSWEKFGIMGRALEADAYPETRANVMRRVEQLAANYLKPAANSSTTHTLPSASKMAATP
jgi:hypothetical protein